jgi:hypothetical protein
VTTFTKLYVGAVIGAGALLLAAFAPREYPQLALTATFLAAMLVVSFFKLRLPLGHGHSTMSMAYVVDFTVIATLGADHAMVIAAAGVLVQCLMRARRQQPSYRTAFSVAAVVLSVQAAGLAWSALGGSIAEPGVATTLVPLAAAAFLSFAINTGLIAGAIALSSRVSPAAVWTSLSRTAPAYAAAAATVAAIQILVAPGAFLVLPVAAAPMIACYLAYAAVFRQMAQAGPTPSAVTT